MLKNEKKVKSVMWSLKNYDNKLKATINDDDAVIVAFMLSKQRLLTHSEQFETRLSSIKEKNSYNEYRASWIAI